MCLSVALVNKAFPRVMDVEMMEHIPVTSPCLVVECIGTITDVDSTIGLGLLVTFHTAWQLLLMIYTIIMMKLLVTTVVWWS
jgi:hypothetical protein